MSAVISPPGSGALASSGVREPLVSVTLPVERYMSVARLVTAGVSSRLDLPFETVDDLQLAVELLVAASFAQGQPATVSFTNDGAQLEISVAPLEARVLDTTRPGFDTAFATAAPVRLRDLLEKLVDSIGTSAEPEPTITVRKALEASRQ
jgi:hypothetical protein